MTTSTVGTTEQVYEIYIRAGAEQVWDAITKPEFAAQYFHGSRIEITPERRLSLSPDGADTWGDDPVAEWDPPRKLVHEWRSMYDPELAAEPASRVTWKIEPQEGGFTKLTVVHDRLEESPKTAASVTGWTFILSGLKTVVETGAPLSS